MEKIRTQTGSHVNLLRMGCTCWEQDIMNTITCVREFEDYWRSLHARA